MEATKTEVQPEMHPEVIELLAAINDRTHEREFGTPDAARREEELQALQARFWAIRDQATEEEHKAVLRAWDRRMRDSAYHAEEMQQYMGEHFGADGKRREFAAAAKADFEGFEREDWLDDGEFFEEGQHQVRYSVMRDGKRTYVPVESCTDEMLRRVCRRLRRGAVSRQNHLDALNAILVQRALDRSKKAKGEAA